MCGGGGHGDGDVVARRAVILAVILVRTRPFVAFFCVLMGLLLCGGGCMSGPWGKERWKGKMGEMTGGAIVRLGQHTCDAQEIVGNTSSTPCTPNSSALEFYPPLQTFCLAL